MYSIYIIYIYKIFKKHDKNIEEEETVFNIKNVFLIYWREKTHAKLQLLL